MKNLMFGIVLSISLIVTSTGCFTRAPGNSSNTELTIASTPAALPAPLSEDEHAPEQLRSCDAFLKKGEKGSSYVLSFNDQEGKAIKVKATGFAAAGDVLVSGNALYPPKKDEQREEKYFRVVGLQEITFKGIPFAYFVNLRPVVSDEKEMRPSILFSCVDKTGKGEFERVGSEDLIVPEWLLHKR